MKRKCGLIGALLTCALTFGVSAEVANNVAPKSVAHRGHWQPAGSAQNSIRSLVKADSIGCYGSEFDVWITSDDVLVVNHDSSIKGDVIEKCTEKTVRSHQLKNGEYVPRLDVFLDSAKQLSTRLVCEVKPHKDKVQEAKAVKKILKMIRKRKLNNRTDYISFSREAVVQLRKEAPKGTEVYYLSGDMSPEELKELGLTGPDYHINVFKKNPDWIKRCHALGLKVNVWTVDKDEDLQWCIDQGVDFITTNRPDRLHELLAK